MEKRQLNLSQDTFEYLHELADSKKGRVSMARQDLVYLLMDYSIMRGLLGHNVIDASRRERPHLINDDANDSKG